MSRTGAAGSRRAAREGDRAAALAGAPLPSAIAAFDPEGDVHAIDSRHPVADPDETGRTFGGRLRAFDPDGDIRATDNRAAMRGRTGDRAAARAAMADEFAARFGIDEDGPSAEALADRFGIRYEESPAGPAGRRTVTITGRGTERAVPPAERSLGRPARGPRRAGPRQDMMRLHADRAALWAVGLALVLAFIAVTSAHGLSLH